MAPPSATSGSWPSPAPKTARRSCCATWLKEKHHGLTRISTDPISNPCLSVKSVAFLSDRSCLLTARLVPLERQGLFFHDAEQSQARLTNHQRAPGHQRGNGEDSDRQGDRTGDPERQLPSHVADHCSDHRDQRRGSEAPKR